METTSIIQICSFVSYDSVQLYRSIYKLPSSPRFRHLVWLDSGDERHLELGGHPFEEVVNFSMTPSVRKSWIGLIGDSREAETRSGAPE